MREAYDALPGVEQSVDYPQLSPQLLPYVQMTPTKDLVVEITVRTPDGMRITVEECVEYELDENGAPKDFEFDDVQSLWLAATATMDARLNR